MSKFPNFDLSVQIPDRGCAPKSAPENPCPAEVNPRKIRAGIPKFSSPSANPEWKIPLGEEFGADSRGRAGKGDEGIRPEFQESWKAPEIREFGMCLK